MSSNTLSLPRYQKQAGSLDPRLLLKYLLGGVGVGAGIGGGVTFVRNLNNLKAQADKEQPGNKADDTFFIQLPENKQAAGGINLGINLPPLTPPVAAAPTPVNDDNPLNVAGKILAAILGTGVGYEGVKSLYSKYRMNQAENDVHKNQTLYLSRLRAGQQLQAGEDPSAKQAGASIGSEIGGGALAMSVLVALASAVGTNKVLENKFPAVKTQPVGPKKVLISSGAPPDALPEPEADKMAAVSELLVRWHMSTKEAKKSGMADILAAVAQGRGDEILDAWVVDPDLAFGLAKQASEAPSDGITNNLALSWLCITPETGPSMAKIAAAEFYTAYPWFCKIAADMPEPIQDALLDFAVGASLKARADAFIPITSQLPEYKIAGENRGILAPLVFLDTASHLMDHKKTDKPDDTQVQPAADKGVDFQVTDNQAKSFLKKYKPDLEKATASGTA